MQHNGTHALTILALIVIGIGVAIWCIDLFLEVYIKHLKTKREEAKCYDEIIFEEVEKAQRDFN